MTGSTEMDFLSDNPPTDFSDPMKALWWLKKGNLKLGSEWEKAHNICQGKEGDRDHDWVHALCHLIEGDHGNATYWFRRAGKSEEGRDVSALWKEIAASLD